ncbi:RNA-directed DNA polymerase, eukaryota [Tanacetum coccineum]
MEVPTRWIKSIPIKVNVFAWKLYLDRLPTRSNLSRRNVSLPSLACPLCDHVLEDSSHLFFGCSVAKDIQKLICRWWILDVHPYESYEDWLSWFKSIRLVDFLYESKKMVGVRRRMELIASDKKRELTIQGRVKGMEKKAYELSTLCGSNIGKGEPQAHLHKLIKLTMYLNKSI